MVDGNGPIEQTSRRQCPVHYWLSGRDKSITLAPLKRISSPAITDKNSHDKDANLSKREPSSSASIETSPDLAETGIIRLTRAEFPQVLVAFRVTKDLFDLDAWVKWLLEAPPEARDLIKIEGFYGSFSSLVLVRIPVQVWSMLPGSSATLFVGFTTTANQALDLQNQVEEQLVSAFGQVGKPPLITHHGQRPGNSADIRSIVSSKRFAFIPLGNHPGQ